MIDITSETFEKKVEKSGLPVVIDCWSPSCRPCMELMPILEALEEEYKGVKFVKLNMDTSLRLAQQFGVMSLPTLLFMNRGRVVERLTGNRSKSAITEYLDRFIGDKE